MTDQGHTLGPMRRDDGHWTAYRADGRWVIGETREAAVQGAAAPELLEACETAEAEAVTLKARLPEPFASNVQAVADKCRAAIAKARG